MATQIITCSIPLELGTFLDENPEISPSKVLQEQLFNIRNNQAKMNERIKAFEIRNGRLSARLEKVLRWVEGLNVSIPEDVLD